MMAAGASANLSCLSHTLITLPRERRVSFPHVLLASPTLSGLPGSARAQRVRKQLRSRSPQRFYAQQYISSIDRASFHSVSPGTMKQGLARKEAAKPLRLCAEKEKGGELMTEQENAQGQLVDTEQQGGPPTAAIIVITSIVLVLGAAAYFIPGGPTEWVKWIEEQIESAGPLAPVYFAAAYITATVTFIPASILTLAAGYIFGPLLGTAVVSVSSTSGAALAFLISRYAARPFVEERLSKYERFLAVDKAISREGWKVVVLLRLSPFFPFALSNYALGLTRIEFVPFVASSWIGMLPATFAYVYLGSAGKATVDVVASGGAPAQSSPLQLGLYALGAVATLGVTTLVSRIASKALSEAEGKEDK